MITKQQSAAATIVELLDNHHRIIRLLEEQKYIARELYEAEKHAEQYSRGVRVTLEMIATESDRICREQGWLRNTIKRADENIESQDQQRIAAEVAAEMEQEKAHQEQLLLDAWYMFDPS